MGLTVEIGYNSGIYLLAPGGSGLTGSDINPMGYRDSLRMLLQLVLHFRETPCLPLRTPLVCSASGLPVDCGNYKNRRIALHASVVGPYCLRRPGCVVSGEAGRWTDQV